MAAADSLRDGDPRAALAALQDEVRRAPGEASHRIFLFQLLAVLGQWERAVKQLQVVAEIDAATLPMVQTYREAIRCEALRKAVFAGKRAPMLMGEPNRWVALLLEALKLEADGEYGKAEQLRGEALEAAPTTAGKIGDDAFEWIADADSRLGPVFEAIVNGRYYWVPYDSIASIAIEEPVDLRDVVWMPALLTLANGGQLTSLIPTRYPGSEDDEDGLIQLARKTDWVEQPNGTARGLGQRLFATDQADYPLMDVRMIQLDAEAAVEQGDGGEADTTPSHA